MSFLIGKRHMQRPPRHGEVSAKDYHFLSEKDFEKGQSGLLEHAKVFGANPEPLKTV
jgi:guanylate kinase